MRRRPPPFDPITDRLAATAWFDYDPMDSEGLAGVNGSHSHGVGPDTWSSRLGCQDSTDDRAAGSGNHHDRAPAATWRERHDRWSIHGSPQAMTPAVSLHPSGAKADSTLGPIAHRGPGELTPFGADLTPAAGDAACRIIRSNETGPLTIACQTRPGGIALVPYALPGNAPRRLMACTPGRGLRVGRALCSWVCVRGIITVSGGGQTF